MAGSGDAHLRKDALLEVRHLTQEFPTGNGGRVQAVTDVSFDVMAGEAFGLVGESGCGKSTAVRAVLQAPPPISGEVRFKGQKLSSLHGGALRHARRGIQMVFQDPYSSLNPRWRVRSCIAEPLRVHKVGSRAEQDARVDELLELVGLDPRRHPDRRPHELSGGQCQRVGIARALALSPDLVVFDEAVSSLDVSIQAQILNLLEQLRRELRLAFVFIAHDLAVVKQVSDRVGVMYLGKLCEIGPAEALYRDPVHPYTGALISAIPRPDPTNQARGTRIRLAGDLPSPADPPSGCRFRTRCPNASERCAVEEPIMRSFGPDHFAACHFPLRRPDERQGAGAEQALGDAAATVLDGTVSSAGAGT